MIIPITITRNDIKGASFHAHYCAEANAVRRTLQEEHKLPVISVAAYRSPKTVRFDVFYGQFLDHNTVKPLIASSRRVRGDLAQWSKTCEETVRWHLGVGSIGTLNNNYTGRDRTTVPETTFTLHLPNFSPHDVDWVVTRHGLERFCIFARNQEIIDITEYKRERELTEMITQEGGFPDLLQLGELPRRDISNCRYGMVYQGGGRVKFVPKGELCVNLFEFRNLESLRRAVKLVKRKAVGGELWVTVRSFTDSWIEAGIFAGIN